LQTAVTCQSNFNCKIRIAQAKSNLLMIKEYVSKAIDEIPMGY